MPLSPRGPVDRYAGPMQLEASDPLSDVLRAVRLDGAHFYCVEAAAPWVVEAEKATLLAPRVLPSSEHLISYHIVAEGRCFGGLSSDAPLLLEAGDVIVFPHGDRHCLASSRELRPRPHELVVQSQARFPTPVTLGETRDPSAERTTFVCGFLGCDPQPFQPLLAALPRVIRMRATAGGALDSFARQALEESSTRRSGASLFLTRLSELMFLEVVRRHVESTTQPAGWLAALRDPCVGRALTELHARPAHAWTLNELAEAVHVSRSALAERFTELVGQPPMQYLTHWRLQLAAGLLVDTGAKVASIAREVGWQSEAAFSRAFKQRTGMSPTDWRSRKLSR